MDVMASFRVQWKYFYSHFPIIKAVFNHFEIVKISKTDSEKAKGTKLDETFQ